MSGKYIKDQAYDEIREKIINCEYEPGEALSELELTKELGFGRTPLHNAFIRLAAEGLVTLIPKKGVIVNGISLNDQLEIFDVRLMIEPELIRKYGDSIELSYLDDYTARCQSALDTKSRIALDEELHSKLREVCRNHYIRNILHDLEGVSHRNRIYHSNETRIAESIKEHIVIVQHLMCWDSEKAAEAMRVHLTNAREFAMKKYL